MIPPPEREREKGSDRPPIILSGRMMAELADNRSQKNDLYVSGHSSRRSRGATILQFSNFLFSTPASVGWYEVLASVHQSYTSSSQASKILNGNSRP